MFSKSFTVDRRYQTRSLMMSVKWSLQRPLKAITWNPAWCTEEDIAMISFRKMTVTFHSGYLSSAQDGGPSLMFLGFFLCDPLLFWVWPDPVDPGIKVSSCCWSLWRRRPLFPDSRQGCWLRLIQRGPGISVSGPFFWHAQRLRVP